MELHANTTALGRRPPDYPGEIPPHHMLRLTLEPAYGLTSWWELGAYLQTARDQDGGVHYAGSKLRSKFMAPKPKDCPFYYGLNLEMSYVPTKFEPSKWGSELRPIFGWKQGRWHATVNPIVDWSYSGQSKSGTPEFEPASKLVFDTRKGFDLGAEYYAGLGPIDHMPRSGQQQQVLYAVFDLLDSATEWNFGVGRGLTPATNDWTIKTIVGRSF